MDKNVHRDCTHENWIEVCLIHTSFGFDEEALPWEDASLRGLMRSSFLCPSLWLCLSLGDRFPLSGDVVS